MRGFILHNLFVGRAGNHRPVAGHAGAGSGGVTGGVCAEADPPPHPVSKAQTGSRARWDTRALSMISGLHI